MNRESCKAVENSTSLDWKELVLGNFGQVYGGLTGKTKEDFGRGGANYVTFLDILENVVINGSSLKSVDVKVDESQNLVKRGDILFTSSSETALDVAMCALVIVDIPHLYVNSFSFGYRINCHYELHALYLTYLMRSPLGRSAIASLAQGSTRYNISKKALMQVCLPRPPIREQRAIATVLSDIDVLLDGLDQLMAKKRDIKQAAMQQLLTGKTRLSGFEGEWEVKQISEFAVCTAGGTPSTLNPEFWDGSIPWMNSGELHQKVVKEVGEYITEYGLLNSSAKMLPAGCVLIGLAGQGRTRGTVAMNIIPLCTNQSIAAILPNSNFVPEYVYHNLDSRYTELRDLSSGSGGRGGLNLTIIGSIVIPFPGISEQRAIAKFLTDMDNEITALEQRRAKTKDIKQAMMQELLTGKTRLVTPMESDA